MTVTYHIHPTIMESRSIIFIDYYYRGKYVDYANITLNTAKVSKLFGTWRKYALNAVLIGGLGVTSYYLTKRASVRFDHNNTNNDDDKVMYYINKVNRAFENNVFAIITGLSCTLVSMMVFNVMKRTQ